jgi:RimJ/RimL family protein N-acetyltransferase
LTDFAFRGLDANRVSIHCDPRNERSRRVAERCGYELEGRLRNAARTPSGTLRDTLIFSRVPE